jgi:hydrogenase maturation protease
MNSRILIAGVGNIFLGDDAFGVAVIQQLAGKVFPAGVYVVDFGIRGLDLTYALLEDFDTAIIVDAVPRGQPPGTLYVIEPEAPDPAQDPELSPGDLLIETHGMHPAKVLRLVAAMGGTLHRVLVVGCEPTPFNPDEDINMSFSPPVLAAIPEAVNIIESLIAKFLENKEETKNPSKGATDHVISDSHGARADGCGKPVDAWFDVSNHR